MRRIAKAITVCLCLAVGTVLCASGRMDVRTLDSGVPDWLEDGGEGTPESAVEEENSVETQMAQLREEITFQDVAADSEVRDAVCYAAYRGMLTGDGDGQFRPDSLATRGQAASALFRMSGEEGNILISAPDVPDGSWYAVPMSWAVHKGMLEADKDGRFRPEDWLTRRELAVMLSGYAGRDEDSESALRWAVGLGMYDTMVSTTVYPDLPVSRGQLAQVLTDFAALRGDPLAAQAELPRSPIPGHGSRDSHQAIQAEIEAVGARYGAAAIQVAVVENGAVTDTYQYGWAVKGKAPVEEETKFRVASLSKVVVGMGALALREEGTVDLDASIGEYWNCAIRNPYYPDTPVTIRSILSHTSSISDSTAYSLNAMRSRLTGSGYSRLVPGSINSWSYNNYAFGVLGTTLELAAGETLNSVLGRRFFDIMDIDAAFCCGSVRDTGHIAAIYRHDGSVGLSVETAKQMACGSPGENGRYFAGGFASSAKDYGKLVALLANDGRYEGLRLLSAESVAAMESLQGKPYASPFQQALPMKYQTGMYGQSRLYYHTGSAYGVYNLMSYCPDTRNGVVVLTTGARETHDKWGAYAVGGDISAYIYSVIS